MRASRPSRLSPAAARMIASNCLRRACAAGSARCHAAARHRARESGPGSGSRAAGWRCRSTAPAGELGQAVAARGHERIAGILARADRRDGEAGRERHGHILHRVHRDVRRTRFSSAASSSLTNSPLPPILASDAPRRRSPSVVMPSSRISLSGYNASKLRLDVARLPQRERALPGGDDYARRACTGFRSHCCSNRSSRLSALRQFVARLTAALTGGDSSMHPLVRVPDRLRQIGCSHTARRIPRMNDRMENGATGGVSTPELEADKDAPLRDDIRLLGRVLGDTLREQDGEAAFELIERTRQMAIRFRRDRDPAAKRELERMLDGLARRRGRRGRAGLHVLSRSSPTSRRISTTTAAAAFTSARPAAAGGQLRPGAGARARGRVRRGRTSSGCSREGGGDAGAHRTSHRGAAPSRARLPARDRAPAARARPPAAHAARNCRRTKRRCGATC